MPPHPCLKMRALPRPKEWHMGGDPSVLKDYWGETLGWTGDFNHARQAAAPSAWALSLALLFPVGKDMLAPSQGGFACWLPASLPLSFILCHSIMLIWVCKKCITFMHSSKRIIQMAPGFPASACVPTHRCTHAYTRTSMHAYTCTSMHLEALEIS